MRGNLREYCYNCADPNADFTVGEVHTVHFDGQPLAFPKTATEVREHLLLSEDVYRFMRDYAREVARIAEQEDFDVFRLLDLDVLWNRDGSLFDRSDRRYLSSVVNAADALLQKDLILEVRLSNAQKGSAPILYPPLIALRRIGEKRGRVMLSSNEPCSERMLKDAVAMLRACGIGCVYVRSGGEWKCIPI